MSARYEPIEKAGGGVSPNPYRKIENGYHIEIWSDPFPDRKRGEKKRARRYGVIVEKYGEPGEFGAPQYFATMDEAQRAAIERANRLEPRTLGEYRAADAKIQRRDDGLLPPIYIEGLPGDVGLPPELRGRKPAPIPPPDIQSGGIDVSRYRKTLKIAFDPQGFPKPAPAGWRRRRATPKVVR